MGILHFYVFLRCSLVLFSFTLILDIKMCKPSVIYRSGPDWVVGSCFIVCGAFIFFIYYGWQQHAKYDTSIYRAYLLAFNRLHRFIDQNHEPASYIGVSVFSVLFLTHVVCLSGTLCNSVICPGLGIYSDICPGLGIYVRAVRTLTRTQPLRVGVVNRPRGSRSSKYDERVDLPPRGLQCGVVLSAADTSTHRSETPFYSFLSN